MSEQTGNELFKIFILTLLNFWQIGASINLLVRIRRNRKSCGISINFQVLCTAAFAFKYLDGHEMEQLGIPAEEILICFFDYWMRILLLITMVATLCVMICYTDRDRLDACWIVGGLLVSLLLGTGTNDPRKDWWIIGSYLNNIAWIAQFAFSVKSLPVDDHTNFWMSSTIFYNIVSSFCSGYDFYRIELCGAHAMKLSFLKFLIFCGFFWKCGSTFPAIEANNAIEALHEIPEPPVQYSVDRPLEEPICCILEEDNASMKNHLLVSSN